jgi:hypothetical protein
MWDWGCHSKLITNSIFLEKRFFTFKNFQDEKYGFVIEIIVFVVTLEA